MAETQQVAVVFTDLVGSTELASRLDPDVADQLRVTHFALLPGAIAANGDSEVKNLGDGLMVAGDRATKQEGSRAPLHPGRDVTGRSAEDDGDYFGGAVSATLSTPALNRRTLR